MVAVPNCQGLEEGGYEVELGVDYNRISFDVVLSFPYPVKCTAFLIHIVFSQAVLK